jgi:ferredoxin
MGADVTAVSSPTRTVAPVAAHVHPAQLAGAGISSVARLTDPDACISCGICVDVCPRSAIEMDDLPTVQESLCTGCNECVDACPRGALVLVAA